MSLQQLTKVRRKDYEENKYQSFIPLDSHYKEFKRNEEIFQDKHHNLPDDIHKIFNDFKNKY